MKRSLTSFVFANGRMFLFLSVVALVAALGILPYYMTARAQIKTGSGLFTRTVSHDPELPNYDIRDAANAKEEGILDFLAAARGSIGKDAAVVADIRDGFTRGEEALKTRLPNVKFEYNTDIRTPEVITPDVWKGRIEWLSSPSTGNRAEMLRSFVKQNNELIGVNDQQADALKVTADYTNPDGNMSFAHLEQLINGVPVFRGEVKAGFTKNGQIIRVINNLAPGLDYDSLSTDFRDPLDAVKAAARHINHELRPSDIARNEKASTNLKTVFGEGDWATTAEKMYFPTEPGVAVAAWRVLIWEPVNVYYVIVDAETGRMLWRKNITEDQTQSATYQVYNNANSYMLAADSPAPLSPGPIDPTTGQQGVNGTRTNVTLIGNEAPNTFNNNGWITDGANITDGNSNQAGIDRDGINGVDAPQTGAPNRVFDSTWNPPPGSPAPGDDPLTVPAQRGAVIQMFYVMNRYHDVLYQRGFTEQAFNFQDNNFGRGGVAADRVSSEGQDSAGTNNANFATPADGGRGRMQMFVWTGPTPDYDGTADAEVIIHEVTHGLSNRLHGNAVGLSTNMSRGMGEGWGDWYSYTMLAEPTDPINGIYTTGGYATFLITAGFTGNYYYGIRRFPRAPITFLGTNGKPHNPFTFRYVNADCNTLIGTTTSNPPPNSAFPRGPVGSATCDQVHNIGEVWSSLLWEVRNRMVTRLGFTAGTTRVLQVVTDGMKLAPAGPTMIQERDAIIAAAAALPLAPEAAADVADVREGFRVRGMGFSASIQNAGTGANNTVVTEAFDVPNAIITNPITVSDSPGDNDGFPEPGENILVSVPITNSSGAAINNVNAEVTGGGGPVSYGNIADGATVTRQLPYTVPAGAACGSIHQVTITGSSALGALNPQNFSFRLGAPVGGAPVTFSNTTALTIPDVGVSAPYGTSVAVAGLSGQKIIKLQITGLTHTFPGDLDYLLVGPNGATQKFSLLSDSGGGGDVSNLTFTLSDAAAAQPSTTQWVAGDFKPVNIGAGDPFAAPAPAAPYSEAPTAGAATFASVFGTDGAAMNGSWSLYLVDDAAGDFGTQTGWSLTFESNDYVCSVAGNSANLGITKTDGVTTVTPGQNITYTIVASNAGPGPVTGATVTDNFPVPALTNINWTCSGAGGGTCTGAGAGNINDTAVNLPVGASVTYTATATVSSGATFGFSNTARVTPPAGTTDPVPGNNSARDTDAICAGASPTRTVFTQQTPTTIPTGPAVVTSTVVVAGVGTSLYDVNLTTLMNHTFAADLDVTLTSPAGTIVTLTTDNGAGNDNVFGGTVWDDDANPAGQVPYVTNNGMVTDHAYTNLTTATPLAPEEALGAFIGENPNGTWTITISDDLTGDGGSLDSWSLDVGTFSAAPATTVVPTVTNNTPVTIPTGPGVVTSTVVVAGAGASIYDVNLTTLMNHTFAADLDVTLTSPAGTIVTLTTDNGAGNDNVFGGTVWDDDANPAGQVPYVTNNGMVTDHAYTNLTTATPLAPEEALAAFVGENPNGTWTLTISDDLTGDGGSLDGWSLNIVTATFPCAATAANVPVSGRVLTPDGYGLRNAIVTITDSTGMTRTTRTTTFGYYTFEGIEVGGTYVISVGSKRYTFTPRTITVNDAVTDLDFIGNGSE